MTGTKGTFVISWSQTEIDGLAGAPVGTIEVGALWRWTGPPVCVDGPNDRLVLATQEGKAELRARAARAVRRLVGPALGPSAPIALADADEPVLDRYFVVSDGRRSFPVTLIDTPQTARPLLLFLGDLPREGVEHWIVRRVEERPPAARVAERPSAIICFAAGTLLSTPQGSRLVETLAEGDHLLTRDDGPQEVLWTGHRHVTGARLHAMPELRPIRIRAGALGQSHPAPDLLVSPQHRLLLKGAIAEDLFNTREVLVAARDMLNDHTIVRDHGLREVRYHHLLLARHQVVWANGVETESFHPALAALESIEAGQRDRLFEVVPAVARNPHNYGAPARRLLAPSEAAILLWEARNRH